MAEYDRRWRAGCWRNYVDAHDEVWEAVQHEPTRFSREILPVRAGAARTIGNGRASAATAGFVTGQGLWWANFVSDRTPPATLAGCQPAPTAWRGIELGYPK